MNILRVIKALTGTALEIHYKDAENSFDLVLPYWAFLVWSAVWFIVNRLLR